MRNLILMATPIDFDEMGAMVAFVREGRLIAGELVDDTGNVPADVLYSGFYMQAPTTEIAQKARLLDTSGMTSSSRALRLRPSGRATTCRSPARCSASWSRSSCARTS